MRTSIIISFATLFTVLAGCERVKYFPDKPLAVSGTRFIAHKGGGDSDGGNTYAGCKYGLDMLDGIECDVQISSNNTLWLSHSSMVGACGGRSERCFASSSDAAIAAADSCRSAGEAYARLEDIFRLMSDSYPGKIISIDAKAWVPCQAKKANIIKEMNGVARAIIGLTEKYHLQNRVMVESELGDFLYYIEQNCDFIETYLTSFGDFELGISRALQGGFAGISFKCGYKEILTKEHIEMMHRKGLKIQLWTVNDTADINEYVGMKADIIQTDNLPFVPRD